MPNSQNRRRPQFDAINTQADSMADFTRRQHAEMAQQTAEFEADLAEQRAGKVAEDDRKEKREKFRSRLAVIALIVAVLALGLGVANFIINI